MSKYKSKKLIDRHKMLALARIFEHTDLISYGMS